MFSSKNNHNIIQFSQSRPHFKVETNQRATTWSHQSLYTQDALAAFTVTRFFPLSLLITGHFGDIDFFFPLSPFANFFFIQSFPFSFPLICLCHYLSLFPPSPCVVFTSTSFSFPISPFFSVVLGRPPLSGKFSQPPHPLIFHQCPSKPHCYPPPLFSPFSLPAHPWRKCICSIPPANRLAGCYQRQEDSDNGFHHIFSLPQIKMG